MRKITVTVIVLFIAFHLSASCQDAKSAWKYVSIKKSVRTSGFPILSIGKVEWKDANGKMRSVTQSARASVCRSAFIFSTCTVVRLCAVTPMSNAPSCETAKCASQRCVRGLNSGTISPVSGSGPSMAALLAKLQALHESARLSKSSAP